MGSLGGATSPARSDTPMMGADLTIGRGRTVLPTAATFEHAVVALDGRVKVGPEVIEPGWREWDERTDRFGSVPTPLERIEAPCPPWLADPS